jgi:uncharacterized SAM-dependent methyltransferase
MSNQSILPMGLFSDGVLFLLNGYMEYNFDQIKFNTSIFNSEKGLIQIELNDEIIEEVEINKKDSLFEFSNQDGKLLDFKSSKISCVDDILEFVSFSNGTDIADLKSNVENTPSFNM